MYGIMRVEKRGRSAVYGIQIENNRDIEHLRDFDRSDIDWSKTDNNDHIIQSDNWNKEITRQIKSSGCKERKNSIVMLDGLFTVSPEWFPDHSTDEIQKYFSDCLNFYVEEYCQGDRSRVINCVVHWDESTPHMHVSSVPLICDERGVRLSARDIMGGRTEYRHRQTMFYEQVSKHYGLDRGEITDRPEERRKHLSVQEYKSAMLDSELKQLKEQKDQLIDDRDEERRELSRLKRQLQTAQSQLQSAKEQLLVSNQQLEKIQRQYNQLPDFLRKGPHVQKSPSERQAEQERYYDFSR